MIFLPLKAGKTKDLTEKECKVFHSQIYSLTAAALPLILAMFWQCYPDFHTSQANAFIKLERYRVVTVNIVW